MNRVGKIAVEQNMADTDKKQKWEKIRKGISELNDRDILRNRVRDIDDLVREYEEASDKNHDGDQKKKSYPISAKDREPSL